jgi:hypothetical protein
MIMVAVNFQDLQRPARHDFLTGSTAACIPVSSIENGLAMGGGKRFVRLPNRELVRLG